MSNENRQPRGIPAGGQFAEKNHAAADASVALADPAAEHTARQKMVARDSRVLDEIAVSLGTSPEWDTGVLSDFAALVKRTGRPGDEYDSDAEFRAAFSLYEDRRGPAAHPDEEVLDEVCDILAQEYGSGADRLEWLADAVARSGRPHPGDQDPAEYPRKLRAAALEQGRRERDAQDDFEEKLAAGTFGDDTAFLQALYDADHFFHEDFDSPVDLRPGHYGAVAEVAEELRAESARVTDGVAEYLEECREYLRGPHLTQDQARAHLRGICRAAEAAPYMESLVWRSVESGKASHELLGAIGQADIEEMASEFGDGALKRASLLLRQAAGSR